jgi:hypothetical protein
MKGDRPAIQAPLWVQRPDGRSSTGEVGLDGAPAGGCGAVRLDGRSTLNHWEWPNDSLLGRLRGRSRDALIELGTPVAYQARQLMIRQGEQSRYALLMLSGCAKVLVSTEFDRDVLIAGACHANCVSHG